MKIVNIKDCMSAEMIVSLNPGQVFMFTDRGDNLYMRLNFEEDRAKIVLPKHKDFIFYCGIVDGTIGFAIPHTEVIPMIAECHIKGICVD